VKNNSWGILRVPAQKKRRNVIRENI